MTDREAVDFLKKAKLYWCVPRKNGKQVTMGLYIEAMTKAINALEEKTMALPIPMNRPHGEWIIRRDKQGVHIYSVCSKCNVPYLDDDFPNFCPNCGSDNRKKVKQND